MVIILFKMSSSTSFIASKVLRSSNIEIPSIPGDLFGFRLKRIDLRSCSENMGRRADSEILVCNVQISG